MIVKSESRKKTIFSNPAASEYPEMVEPQESA